MAAQPNTVSANKFIAGSQEVRRIEATLLKAIGVTEIPADSKAADAYLDNVDMFSPAIPYTIVNFFNHKSKETLAELLDAIKEAAHTFGPEGSETKVDMQQVKQVLMGAQLK